MNIFSDSDFPALGSTPARSPEKTVAMSPEKTVARERWESSLVAMVYRQSEDEGPFHKECFICGSKGDIPRGNGHMRCSFMTRDCVKVVAQGHQGLRF